jgi:hypothetical protein
MGTKFEFNHILKINKLENEILEDINSKGSGKFIKGLKEDIRVYPNETIIAVDKEWNAFAAVVKKQKVESSEGDTGFTFELQRYLSKEEKRIFTNFYKEYYSE